MIANKKSIYYLRLFLDLILLNIAFISAAILSQSLQILLARTHMFVLLAILNFLWYFVSNVVNFYDNFNTKYFSYQFINIIKNVITQIITGVLFIFLIKEDLFTRNFIVYYAALLAILVSIRIVVVRFILTRIRGKEKNLKNVIIIGAGEIGKNFKTIVKEHTDLGYNFKGFLDDNSFQEKNEEIIGKIDGLDKILSTNSIDEVIIALPIYASNQFDDIIKICNKHAVRVHIIPDYFRFVSKKFQINMLGDFPIITVRNEPLSEAHWRFVKRTFDLIFSFFAILLILSWLVPLIIILNKIYGDGSAIFLQDRIGSGNTVFKCFKFRTMKTHIENKDKFQPTYDGDPRVTKLGKFLRKSNLDEFPQFINILKGEMSVVGPRPHPIPYNEIYQKVVGEIRIRSWVKPGLTGWAQVHGLRGDVFDEEENKKRIKKRVEHDLWYIENWSIWLDIQIILLTIWQMIKGDTNAV